MKQLLKETLLGVVVIFISTTSVATLIIAIYTFFGK
jgi:hypothetical protein